MTYREWWHKKSAKELSKSFGFLKLGEVELLDQLVKTLPKDPLIINLGAGVGTSAMTILEARDDSFVVTVDRECGEHPLGGLQNEHHVIRAAKWLHRRVGICSESATAGKNWWHYKEESWWRRKADMVIHDATHEYDPVTAEIKAWLPRVRAKGIIMAHDYSLNDWTEVVKAVDILLRPQFKFIDKVDMLIAFRKEKP
jgi:predicted O-methyltransferase YrrM